VGKHNLNNKNINQQTNKEMKTTIFTLSLCLSALMNFAQFNLTFDKQYYNGYIITNDWKVPKDEKPFQKIECKIKNKDYFYAYTQQNSETYYVDYITPDGKSQSIYWARISEIKTDSFYYKRFTFHNDEIARRSLEGRINYWINPSISFFVINDSVTRSPFANESFIVKLTNNKKMVETNIKNYKIFMAKLVKDDAELVAEIKSDTYLDFTKSDGAFHRNNLKIIKEYNDWYKKNHS
jgi:hypothetical protein